MTDARLKAILTAKSKIEPGTFDKQALNSYLLNGLFSISTPYPIKYASLMNCHTHPHHVIKQTGMQYRRIS